MKGVAGPEDSVASSKIRRTSAVSSQDDVSDFCMIYMVIYLYDLYDLYDLSLFLVKNHSGVL